MPVNWDEVKKELAWVKSYEDLSLRWQEAFAYPFVREKYNFTMAELTDHTRHLLGEDPLQRYTDYQARLVKIFDQLQQAGVKDLLELTGSVDSRDLLEAFTDRNGIDAVDMVAALKYLIYWFIPAKKYLSSLIVAGSPTLEAVKILRGLGIRSNLDILAQGKTPQGREALKDLSGLAERDIQELVNVADLSRLPWTSKATISNIIGAGFGSLSKLKNANLEKLSEDFYRYGKSIGKNLKLGNEIENLHRIAKLFPVVVEE